MYDLRAPVRPDEGPSLRATRSDEEIDKSMAIELAPHNITDLVTGHRRGDEFREKENCIKLRLDDLVSVFRFFLLHTAAQRDDASVVYQDARVAEFVFDPVERGLQCSAVGHIQLTAIEEVPNLFSSESASWFFSSFRPNIATGAPASAKPRAMLRPIPPLPPVTTATRPVRSNRVGIFIERSPYRVSGVD